MQLPPDSTTEVTKVPWEVVNELEQLAVVFPIVVAEAGEIVTKVEAVASNATTRNLFSLTASSLA